MTRLIRPHRALTLVATGLAAVALTASMSACSSSSEDAAGSASAASDQAVTATAADTDEDATVPDGFTLVEVPDYDISVAVPSGWDTLTSADTSDTELVGRIAQALDHSEDEVISDLEDTPLTSVDTTSDADVPPYLVLGRIDGEGALPSEEQMRSLAEDDDAEATDYEQTASGSGADARIFTMSESDDVGTQHYVAAVAVSDGDDAYFASVIVADSEEQLKEISDALIASL